jgi:hypothetical protein
VYAIIEEHGHTHLAYVLELPDDIGTVQKAFNIQHEGSFIISVKNPDIPSPFGYTTQAPDYPKDLTDLFEGKRWRSANPGKPHFYSSRTRCLTFQCRQRN